MSELHTSGYDRELSELLAGLLEDNLSDEQFERLDERLRHEPAARQRYLDYIEIHDELPEMVVSLSNDDALEEPAGLTPVSRPEGERRESSRTRSYRAAFWSGSAIAALLLMGVLLNWTPGFRDDVPPHVRVSTSQVHFANLAQARFFGELTPSIRSAPILDRDYVLQAGMVELAFPKGATAIIEAPAVFRVKSDEHLALHVGNCSVHAPEGAEGFHVETPATCVVDRGTRFSVSVSETNATEVQVIEGAADVYRRTGEATRPSEKNFQARLLRNEAHRYSYAAEAPGEVIPFNSASYQYALPDRVVSYTATEKEGQGARDLVSVTVQRGGRQIELPVGELVPAKLTWFKAPSGMGNFAGEEQLPRFRRDSASDRSLITGAINPGGSVDPLQSSPILSGEAGTPGMAIRFDQPVINGPGPDVVFFELQGPVNPTTGDRFHVSPLEFRQGLKSHTIESFDLTMESPHALELADFYVHMFSEPPSNLEELETIECSPVLQALKFRALAVGIDLSDLGYAPGERVNGLFFQDALDDKHTIDPVFIGGLPPLDDH
ncbi:FecR domain-containing protein [Rubinisphaera margarita]|uniref:FecR domain-containing protein n=1 Tax=Rubinisphaera margarita TaxID=2909586 RepID=UPI001EE824AC|nr:FecR domain-containing protein [Rubinisphaera margarita]MCG6158270.1 FecR family protein [Rubinisphaera margarita]